MPGLIVQISDSKGHYSYELIKVKNVAGQNITFSKKKHVKTTPEELARVKRETLENLDNAFMQKLGERGSSVSFGDPSALEKMRKRGKEIAAKKNNPIELTYE